MCRTISIFNMKGGVGKTTTAYNLAAGLADFFNKKVLLVDIDPQGNSSASFGIKIWDLELHIKDVLLRKASIQDTVITIRDNIDVVPANISLAEDEIPISGLPGRELLLRKAIAKVQDRYDFILIDCPPNIGVFSMNALMASDEVLIPVDLSFLGLLGLKSIEKALDLIHTALDHQIKITGVLATRYDGRTNVSKEVLESLKSTFAEKMFDTVIPENVRIKEAPGFSIPVYKHDKKSEGAKAYTALVKEVVSR